MGERNYKDRDSERAINKEQRVMSSRVANALRFHREQKGLTVNELARRSGVSSGYISRIENGLRRNISIPVLMLLSEALNTNLFVYLNLNNEEEKTKRNIEELLLEYDFSINGKSLDTPKQKNLLIDIVSFITTEMNDMTSNFNKQCQLLKLVHEFNQVVDKPS